MFLVIIWKKESGIRFLIEIEVIEILVPKFFTISTEWFILLVSIRCVYISEHFI